MRSQRNFFVKINSTSLVFPLIANIYSFLSEVIYTTIDHGQLSVVRCPPKTQDPFNVLSSISSSFKNN